MRASGVTVSRPKQSKSRRRPPSVANATPAAAQLIWETLATLYPEAHCELDYRSPYELLVATILSAQCTDKRVNAVTPAFFARFPDAGSLAGADTGVVEDLIRSTGFFRAKTRALLGAAQALAARHDTEVPATMEQLVALPGVGRKTANVVLGNAFGINEGIVVDTHVGRLAVRLGLTRQTDPVKVERDLMLLFPTERWTMLSHLLIWHGRRVCDARRPRCAECALQAVCPSARLGPS